MMSDPSPESLSPPAKGAREGQGAREEAVKRRATGQGAREEAVKRRATGQKYWARLVLVVMAAGIFLLFPRLQRAEIEFRYRIDDPKCVERVELQLFEGDILARANRQLVEGRKQLVHSAKLSRGEFRAEVSVECRDGSTASVSKLLLVVEDDAVIDFKVSGRECRCSSG